jgi:hypothetical protein
LEDPAAWAQANPGLGIRISLEHIASEHDGALGPREFAVERLGVGDWPATDGSARQPISPSRRSRIASTRGPVDGPVCFAFDVKPDRSSSSIGVAGAREDGLRHIEVVDQRAGTAWVVPRLVESDGPP